MSQKILIALDFSKLGRDVADYGYELGAIFGADLTFMHVIPEPNVLLRSYSPSIPLILDKDMAELKKTAEKKLHHYIDGACAKYSQGELVCRAHVEIGDSAQSIVEYAKAEGFDMIVLGYRGHSVIDRLLVGSTASKVANYAPCSVLIYRPKEQ